MALYTLEHIVNIARACSSFYKNLYKDVPDKCWKLEDLPIIKQKDFWMANSFSNNQVLTKKLDNGIILTSGGTTGDPKFSVYSKDEWHIQSRVLGCLLKNNGIIKSNDRIANLLSVGKLYGAFLLIHDALMNSLAECLELPISRNAAIEYMVDIIIRFNPNIIIGFPLTLVNLCSYIRRNGITLNLERIIYGGETMYSDQLSYIKNTFPSACVSTCVYSSTDGGLLGYFSQDCSENEHRVEDSCSILEIIDENGRVIYEPHQEGTLLVTSLFKTLMPVIRYPTGDKGIWLETSGIKNRKFKLLGRSENLIVNFHDMDFDLNTLSSAVTLSTVHIELIGFQLIIDNKMGQEICTLNIATDQPEKTYSPLLATSIKNNVFKKFPSLEMVLKNTNSIFDVAFINPEEIQPNLGSGKHRRILDLRVK